LKILDASRVLAGPYAAMMLGDLGHDVIKVEAPGTGDQTRAWGPPWQEGESAYYRSINRNKRSLTLNLKHPDGQELFRRLAAQSDVLIENFRPGDLDAWGLGWEALSKLNPRLVFCSITGYGQTGPWKDRPAYDLALQAEAGWMSITGEAGQAPVRVGVAVIDILTAHFAVQAILSALLERERTGKGRRLDIAMFDSAVVSLTYMAQNVLATGEAPGRMGSRHPSIVPYQAFPTRDGWIVVAVGSDAIWKRFCPAIGLPHLLTHPDFRDNPLRVRHRAMLEPLLARIFASRPTGEWTTILQANDIPATPVNDVGQVLALPQTAARRLVQENGIRSVPGPHRPPPGLGIHTEEILRELGESPSRIAELHRHGAI
jgi:crotonobetainyl-CoA:carnitine CoA-transferase CaiB-like acyl-CoA transferase